MKNLFNDSRVDSCPSLRRPRGGPAAGLSGGPLGTRWNFRPYAGRLIKGSVSRIGVLAGIGLRISALEPKNVRVCYDFATVVFYFCK